MASWLHEVAGASAAAADGNGWGMAHCAAVQGQLEVLRWMQRVGLEVWGGALDGMGKTPLDWAEVGLC